MEEKMSEEFLPQYVQALLNPAMYHHQVQETELIQTHISYVVLAGDFVYKWKKEVDFGFLNFSSLALRELNCQRELELNRRLCPDLYLEVVSLTQEGDNYTLNGSGEIVEYGVKMKRMDQQGLMSNKIEKGQLTVSMLDDVVEQLVPFYEDARGNAEVSSFGVSEAVGVNVIENFDQTESFAGSEELPKEIFDGIKRYATEFLKQEKLFQERIDNGKICDCHGDLYSANICFDGDKTYIFDCIEFNERFRFTDVAADIGFLAMDLDYHNLSGLADSFVEKYVASSKDTGIYQILDFYKCYRAYVRGKIGLFTAADAAVPVEVAKKCKEDAKLYFKLAARYAGC